MTTTLIDEAHKIVPKTQILVNMVSKRVRQLNNNTRPMVDVGPFVSSGDIALKEIIERKLTAEPTSKKSAA